MSSVVYYFGYARCNSCYARRAHKHFNTRRKQPLEIDQNSNIQKHLSEN